MVVKDGAELGIGSRVVVLLLLVAALAIGLRGLASLPPDEHEILVLRTTQEMHARGDWIVPYFNDEPRLKKPPLSYWLTGLAAALSGGADQVVAWHGRLPSLLAGLTMAAMLMWTGRRFYGERAALYATCMFVASVGFFTYTHDGRPDFLYAALCTAGWMAGAVGLIEARGVRMRPMLLMWLGFALATLAKGPHIPFMLVVAMALFCLSRQPRGSLSLRALRPLLGLALVALITVPWWLALHTRLDPTAVHGSQLAGRLLVPGLEHLFNGYYLYRPLQLLLPWVPLAPLAWVAIARDRSAARPFTVYLMLCAGAVAMGLSLGVQQRFFYMLPVLPALCLLAGHGLATLERERPRLAVGLCGLQALLIAGGAGWLFLSQRQGGWLAVAAMAALLVAVLTTRTSSSKCVGGMLFGVVLTAASFARFADSHALWSVARFDRHALANAAAKVVAPGQALFSFALTPVLYIQVTGRTIHQLQSVTDIEGAMRERQLNQAHVLTLVKRQRELQARFEVRELALMPQNANDRAGLYLITLRKQ